MNTSIATLTLVDHRIIHVFVHDNTDFGVQEMKEIREKNSQLVKGKDYCVVFEMGSFAEFSNSAKEDSISSENSANKIAVALITNNLAQKIVADIYLRVYKPKTLTKPFNNKNEAIKWLQTQRDKHISFNSLEVHNQLT